LCDKIPKKDQAYYWKSQKGKDRAGNTIFHSLFETPLMEDRFKFLKLLIQENIGDLNMRNKLGYLPTDLDHSITINDIPNDLREHFQELDLLSQEADYMIITNQSPSNMNKKEIIITQLKQLNLVEGKDFVVYVMDPHPRTKVSKVLISI
jgi:hypothetical protein